MLNWTSKLTLVATVVAGTLSFAANASAGEGGLVGVASFNLDISGAAGVVENASVGTAVGKVTAYGGAQTEDDGSGNVTTEAIAAGTGAMMTLTGDSIFIDEIDEESTDSLDTAQANQLDDQDTTVTAPSGTVDIDN